ncbi:MAG TPA: haloalkane dehalogenase [Nevskiaceae bacterium]|nr:haloalkane dehalogenase [Nevskiaceae bacterium]
MKILRTPDQRFAGLPGYPYAPHYAQLGELRMHYVDEGPRDGAVVLMLHGEPSWSYLYRRMIPPFVAAGYRVLAPALIGFGKSDKPSRMADYSYQRHVDWLLAWIEQLDLTNVTLIVQDWGSLLGLRIAALHGARFSRIVVANGFLPTGTGASKGFRRWRAFATWSPWFPIGRIVGWGCLSKLSPEVIAAYDAPFPSAKYKAGARAFPRLVPMEPDNVAVPENRKAWDALGLWNKPFLTVFGKRDPILGRSDKPLQEHVPGARGQPHRRINGSHFVQEDCGEELAQIVLDWLKG